MDDFVKPTKIISSVKAKTTASRTHPYKPDSDQIKDICCYPREQLPLGAIFTSAITGHQVSEKARSTSYFASRNAKLAVQHTQNLAMPTGPAPPRQIFRNCVVYVNGYMGPTISDLELRKRLCVHGASVVGGLARRSVTHVILGPLGLAGGKVQKEMEVRKAGVKYVTVDWYKVGELG
jgi:hypothetical protein